MNLYSICVKIGCDGNVLSLEKQAYVFFLNVQA